MKVSIYKKPSISSTPIIKVSKNTKLQYIKEGDDNAWIKVSTSNGIIGWVEKKRIKKK